MSRQAHFILNTQAGSSTPERANLVVRGLEAGGIRVTVYPVTDPAEAGQCAHRICGGDKHPLLIVGGGDGTINGVVNGLPFGSATLAVVPLGKANVLAREIGIRSIEHAVERIIAGETRWPTVGLLQAERLKRYFILMAGVGLDGNICETVRPAELTLLGRGAYLTAALRLLAAWERERLELYVNGMRVDCHSVVVCNVARYGGGFILAPEAYLFTPEFQVVCLKDDRRRSYLKLVLNTLLGRYPDAPEIRWFPAAKLVVSGRKAIQADGDFMAYSPARFSCVEQLFRLVV